MIRDAAKLIWLPGCAEMILSFGDRPLEFAAVLPVSEEATMYDHDAKEVAIAYECARECIVHMMAIYTNALHHTNPTQEDCAAWRTERTRLAVELRELRLNDYAAIARVREDYGARIKRGWKPQLMKAGQ